jgi:hypothetical protein
MSGYYHTYVDIVGEGLSGARFAEDIDDHGCVRITHNGGDRFGSLPHISIDYYQHDHDPNDADPRFSLYVDYERVPAFIGALQAAFAQYQSSDKH